MSPEKTVARYLISTPCSIVGNFSTDDIAIDHAWSRDPASSSRHYYVISVSHEEHTPAAGVVLPSYLPYAELIVALASVWFGKRFDVHGPLQEHGSFRVPTLWATHPVDNPKAGPFSHTPRTDLNIDLTWSFFRTPMECLRQDNSHLDAFVRATRFYACALRSFNNDPEVAFLHLITSIEILAAQMDFNDDQVFDSGIREILSQIRKHLPDGERVERIIRSRLYQLGQKVSLCAVELTTDTFFEGSGAAHPAAKLTEKDLAVRMKKAYELRSKFVHTGADFGTWLRDIPGFTQEIQMGRPMIQDKELARPIRKAPTLAGLERLVRFMTLRFAHQKIASVHDGLD